MNRWIYEDEQIFTRDELYTLCRRFDLTVLREYTSPLIHEIGIVARRSE
jgi:hypothetical protein